jgi:AcrR family transcriptional regulator
MPAPRRRDAIKKTYHHRDLANALIGAALEIVEERGAEALTLREVAAAVGVTHAAAYRHFDDKAALLAAVAERGFRALTLRLREVAEAREPHRRAGDRATLDALLAAYVEYGLTHPAVYQVMSGPRLNEDNRFAALEEAVNEAFHVILDAIEDAQRRGSMRGGASRDVAVGLWVTAHGFVELVQRRRIKVKSTRRALAYFAALVAPHLDGLLP